MVLNMICLVSVVNKAGKVQLIRFLFDKQQLHTEPTEADIHFEISKEKHPDVRAYDIEAKLLEDILQKTRPDSVGRY